jgi:hypothetical protein
MRLISHRGNLLGIEKKTENNPDQIDKVLSMGFDCEIDIFLKNKTIYLGHDSAKYKINLNWILKRKNNLWVHCKNLEALEMLFNYNKINYFWHENDKATITSHGYIWSHVDSKPIKNSVIVLPEKQNRPINNCFGICSDYILYYI